MEKINIGNHPSDWTAATFSHRRFCNSSIKRGKCAGVVDTVEAELKHLSGRICLESCRLREFQNKTSAACLKVMHHLRNPKQVNIIPKLLILTLVLLISVLHSVAKITAYLLFIICKLSPPKEDRLVLPCQHISLESSHPFKLSSLRKSELKSMSVCCGEWNIAHEEWHGLSQAPPHTHTSMLTF